MPDSITHSLPQVLGGTSACEIPSLILQRRIFYPHEFCKGVRSCALTITTKQYRLTSCFHLTQDKNIFLVASSDAEIII